MLNLNFSVENISTVTLKFAQFRDFLEYLQFADCKRLLFDYP